MDLPDDLQRLIDLCRHDLDGDDDRPLRDDRDVDALVKLADAHRLTPIIERSWRRLSARLLAPDLPTILSDRAARARKHSFFAAAHLARLARAFEAGSVPWRSLKGPALSVQLHGDATVRMVRDLDIIVPKPAFAAAVAVAVSAGWKAPSNWRDLLGITGRYELALQPTMPGQPLLELHGTLGPRYTQFALDPFAQSASGTVQVADVAVPTLGGDAQATYVAWHGARGFWYRLTWLVDFARMLQLGERDVDGLLETARRCQAESAVRAGALFAHRLLGVPLPPWPRASTAVAKRVDTMVRWSFERLSLGVDAPSVWSPPGSHLWLWREVAQQPNRWRAAIGALDHLARPTESDAERLGLSRPLAMHRLARPFFLARRLLRSDPDKS